MARWTDEDRTRALAAYREQGLAGAAESTGVPKSTIKRWALADGVDVQEVHAALAERVQSATAVRRLKVAEEAEATKDKLIPKVALAADLALDVELTVLAIARDRVRAVREYQQQVAARGAADVPELPDIPSPLPEGVRLRDIVGARTRAVHDFLLMSGDATERMETEQTVVFTAPRPQRQAPEVVDLAKQDVREKGRADVPRAIGPGVG